MNFEKAKKLLLPSTTLIQATQIIFIVTIFIYLSSLFYREGFVSILETLNINPTTLRIIPIRNIFRLTIYFEFYLVPTIYLTDKIGNDELTFFQANLLNEVNLLLSIALLWFAACFGLSIFTNGIDVILAILNLVLSFLSLFPTKEGN
ncbi:hypothetical protein [Limosilactobacillus mucosae]|uniref:hypothetical protein n=1 Tax=Limosilactobacillus mucosae TaxID=97478 RepID=UPI0006527722|nr:hypothetical protein [Limosilactobacillus mucosae]